MKSRLWCLYKHKMIENYVHCYECGPHQCPNQTIVGRLDKISLEQANIDDMNKQREIKLKRIIYE